MSVCWAAYLGTASIRMASARALLQQPSEILLEHKVGYRSECESILAVAFWQQGPGIPERQGYVCGGVLSDAKIVVVPFADGSTTSDPL